MEIRLIPRLCSSFMGIWPMAVPHHPYPFLAHTFFAASDVHMAAFFPFHSGDHFFGKWAYLFPVFAPLCSALSDSSSSSASSSFTLPSFPTFSFIFSSPSTRIPPSFFSSFFFFFFLFFAKNVPELVCASVRRISIEQACLRNTFVFLSRKSVYEDKFAPCNYNNRQLTTSIRKGGRFKVLRSGRPQCGEYKG